MHAFICPDPNDVVSYPNIYELIAMLKGFFVNPINTSNKAQS